MNDDYVMVTTMTSGQLYFVVFALSSVWAIVVSYGLIWRPRASSAVQTGKVPTGRNALSTIARAITLTLGRITFAVLHFFERIGVDMSVVDDALAAWTQYANDQKAHLVDVQNQLVAAQQALQTSLADRANDVTAEDAKVADQIKAALELVKNPPQPPTPVTGTDASTTPAPAPVVDTGDPISNPAPTPVVSGDQSTAGEVAADDPSTPVVPAAGVDADGNVAPGVQPQAAGDVPPSTPVVPVTTDPSVDGTTSTVVPSEVAPVAGSTPTDAAGNTSAATTGDGVTTDASLSNPPSTDNPVAASGAGTPAALGTTTDAGSGATVGVPAADDPSTIVPVDPTTPAGTDASAAAAPVVTEDPNDGAADQTATASAPVAADPSAPPVSAASLPAGTPVVEVAPAAIPGSAAVIPDNATVVSSESLPPSAQVTPVQDTGTATS